MALISFSVILLQHNMEQNLLVESLLRRYNLPISIGFLLLMLGIIGCTTNSSTQDQDQEVVALPTVQITSADIVLNQDLVADIQAINNVEIRARVDGFLDAIYVDEGKSVAKGQKLFKLADEEYRVAVSKAKADLSIAEAEAASSEIEVERVRDLVNKKVVSAIEQRLAESKLIAARAKVEAARSDLANAEIKLTFTHINAPFNGVVDRLPLKKGSLIKEGTQLTTISDLSSVFAYFHLSEKQYLQFKSGKGSGDLNNGAVQLILADGTQYPSDGYVETMQGEFQEETGSLSFRARFPNPDGLLKHGATGKVKLSTAVKAAILVPQKSCFEVQDKTFVYVVDKSGKVSTRSFVPSARYNSYYVVKDGLKPNETIVYEGFQSIKDGSLINSQPTKHKDAI